MILEIVIFGHSALRTKGKRIEKIDDKIRQLASDMLETMYDAHGIGLAAQQVGVPLQLTVIDVAGIEDRPSTMTIGGKKVDLDRQMPLVLVNPELELSKTRATENEGCLSFPTITVDVSRSLTAKVKAQQIDGTPIEFEATGLLARALQHEVDHLNGVLFIDRANSASKVSLAGKLKRMKREYGG